MIDWTSTSVLITGGSGSLGRALVARLLEREKPRRIIIFSRDEGKHLLMRQSLDDPDERLRFFIGDVRDRDRLCRAMHGVDIVVHAAAIKEIESCETNVIEAVRTNVDGSINVVEAAVDTGVSHALLVSTDKAVSPCLAYGMTKGMAERIFVHGNTYAREGRPIFSAVRYGNVIGSRGSVLEVWRDAIRRGRPIEVTTATRFWITMPQAVEFVLSSIERMEGSEVFIPILPASTITTLANAFAPEADHRLIGLRAGEKAHEVLISADEARSARREGDRYVLRFGTDYSADPSFSVHRKGYGSDSLDAVKLSITELHCMIEV
jgi:UDP-N-acetylglucosamine 4,6-dehydratase